MRLIGIGLLAFVLMGAAFTLSYLDAWQRSMHHLKGLVSGPQLVFETSAPLQSKFGSNETVIYRRDTATPIILSGLPAYQNAIFGLPVDTRPTQGYLQIDATYQVLSEVEGTLRISLNGTRRAEVLLRPGEVKKSVQIILTPADLAGDKIEVSFSMIGARPNAGCSAETSQVATVEIEPSSALFLALDSPIESARDRMISSSGAATVGWSPWFTATRRTNQMIAAAQLVRGNTKVNFVAGNAANVLTTPELKILAAEEGPIVEPPKQWPLAVASTGPNAGLRRFQRRVSWRTRYDLSEYEAYEMPATFDFDLLLGFLDADAYWTVTTSLNGRVVQMDKVPVGDTSFGATVDLPADLHEAVNVIEVTASSSQLLVGACNNGPELIAEMQSDAQLIGGGPSYLGKLSELRTTLAKRANVGMPEVPALTPAEAEAVALLIAAVLPEEMKIKKAPQWANITPFSRADLGVLSLEDDAAANGWLVYTHQDDDEIIAEPVSDAAIAALRLNPVTGILVQFSNPQTKQAGQ